jgi:hypothetical protein
MVSATRVQQLSDAWTTVRPILAAWLRLRAWHPTWGPLRVGPSHTAEFYDDENPVVSRLDNHEAHWATEAFDTGEVDEDENPVMGSRPLRGPTWRQMDSDLSAAVTAGQVTAGQAAMCRAFWRRARIKVVPLDRRSSSAPEDAGWLVTLSLRARVDDQTYQRTRYVAYGAGSALASDGVWQEMGE